MTSLSHSAIDYDDLVQPDRVHGRLYYDQAIFEEELEKIWYREWIYVGHASEIPQSGDYRTRMIGLQPVIMTRDEDGGVHLLMNRCAHRGNTVCQMERGNSHAFRCAYHGWTFANDGHLLGVTYASAYGPDFNRDEYGLTKTPRMAMYRGFIFGSMSPDGPTLDDHLGPAKRIIDDFVDLSPTGEIEVRSGIHKMIIDSNWKMWVENAVDNYHANFIHQSAFELNRELRDRVRVMSADSSIAVTRDLGNGHTLLDFMPQQRLTGRLMTATPTSVPESAQKQYMDAMSDRFGREQAIDRISDGPPHGLIYPNLFLIQHDIRTIQPVAANKSYNYMYPVLLKGAPAEINTLRLRLHEGAYGPAGFVLTDDLDIFERNQLATNARAKEWMYLKRGLNNEKVDTDGSITGHIAAEGAIRAQWRHYLRLMNRA